MAFDKYEHLVRYYGYYSNRSRGARLIQKVYAVDRLECPDCGATLRIIALIDDPGLCGVFFIRRMSGNGRGCMKRALILMLLGQRSTLAMNRQRLRPRIPL